MKILCVMGQHNYGDPARGEGYEFTNFLPALRNLGHEVVFFESFNRSRFESFSDLNRSLLEEVEREKPELVLFVLMGYEVWLETLHVLREWGAVLVNWGTDDSWKYDRFARFIAPRVDVYVTTCHSALRKARRDGLSNVVLSQWAASAPMLAEPLPAAQCRHSVTFIGSAYGDRPRWITALKRRGIEVECFGLGWPSGPVPARDVPRIIRNSVISLNFADAGPHGVELRRTAGRQIKARTFEVPGAGGFLLTEHVARLDEYYEVGKEIAVFDGEDDLVAKIQHYLGHPEERDRIASAGHRRTRDDHTYDVRFRQILGRLPARIKSAGSDAAYKFDPAWFGSLANAHATNGLLRGLRACLVGPCRLIWGKQRGPRAARQLLFEASWRLFGEQTYCATGLPGRLFYGQS